MILPAQMLSALLVLCCALAAMAVPPVTIAHSMEPSTIEARLSEHMTDHERALVCDPLTGVVMTAPVRDPRDGRVYDLQTLRTIMLTQDTQIVENVPERTELLRSIVLRFCDLPEGEVYLSGNLVGRRLDTSADHTILQSNGDVTAVQPMQGAQFLAVRAAGGGLRFSGVRTSAGYKGTWFFSRTEQSRGSIDRAQNRGNHEIFVNDVLAYRGETKDARIPHGLGTTISLEGVYCTGYSADGALYGPAECRFPGGDVAYGWIRRETQTWDGLVTSVVGGKTMRVGVLRGDVPEGVHRYASGADGATGFGRFSARGHEGLHFVRKPDSENGMERYEVLLYVDGMQVPLPSGITARQLRSAQRELEYEFAAAESAHAARVQGFYDAMALAHAADQPAQTPEPQRVAASPVSTPAAPPAARRGHAAARMTRWEVGRRRRAVSRNAAPTGRGRGAASNAPSSA